MRASQILSSVFLSGLFLAGCGSDGDDGDGNGDVDSGLPDETETGSEPEPTPPEPTPPEPDVPTDTATEPPTDTSTDTPTDVTSPTDTGGTSLIDGGVGDGGVDPVTDGGADAGDGGGVLPPVEVDAGSACDTLHNICDPNASCAEPVDGGLAPVCDCAVGLLGDGTSCTLPATCKEIIDNDPTAPSGTYTLATAAADGGAGTLEVYCEMTTAGGGWVEAFTGDSTWDPANAPAEIGYTMPITIDPANGSSMMIDFSDSPMGPNEYSIRLIIEETADDVDPGVTLQQLFTDPELINWDLTANNRAGLTVLQQGSIVPTGDAGADAGPPVPADCAAVALAWPGLSAAICGATGTQHLVIQDQSVGAGCAGSTYTIGVSSANNCFGWPEAVAGQFPEYVRIWIR